MIFEENNTHPSEYYLKESNYSLEFNIETTKLILDNNKINITYNYDKARKLNERL